MGKTNKSSVVITTEHTLNNNDYIQLPGYSVMATPNGKELVVDIYSTKFRIPGDNDVVIKTGNGDEFVHVGYYQVMDDRGVYNYKIVEVEKQIEVPKLDSEGNHSYHEVEEEITVDVEVPELDENGEQVMEEVTVPTMIEIKTPIIDECCGHQKVDEEGNPLFDITYEEGTETILEGKTKIVQEKQVITKKVYEYETETVMVKEMAERTVEEKDEDFNSRPKPIDPIQNLESDVQFLQEDIDTMFIAVDETSQAAMFNVEDISFVVSAIFELDEKISNLLSPEAEGISSFSLSDKSISGKEVNFVAELWARWITTNRRTFDQVPSYLKADVKVLLLEAGYPVE